MNSTSQPAYPPLTNGVAKLLGNDGNAFGVLGRVRQAILNSNHPELADAFMREATSRDYAYLLATCARYVTVE